MRICAGGGGEDAVTRDVRDATASLLPTGNVAEAATKAAEAATEEAPVAPPAPPHTPEGSTKGNSRKRKPAEGGVAMGGARAAPGVTSAKGGVALECRQTQAVQALLDLSENTLTGQKSDGAAAPANGTATKGVESAGGGKGKKDGEHPSYACETASGSGAEGGGDGGGAKVEDGKDESGDVGVGSRRSGKGRNGGAGSKAVVDTSPQPDPPPVRPTRTTKSRS
jgi:hypothetical protein